MSTCNRSHNSFLWVIFAIFAVLQCGENETRAKKAEKKLQEIQAKQCK